MKPTTAYVLTSPAGSGPINITEHHCYPNGTGTNPERDADFTVAGPRGTCSRCTPPDLHDRRLSPTSPMVFIEDKPAPYTEPDIHIYAAFNVTVSGSMSAISSGQQVNVGEQPRRRQGQRRDSEQDRAQLQVPVGRAAEAQLPPL